jgi:hypothetical protein
MMAKPNINLYELYFFIFIIFYLETKIYAKQKRLVRRISI